MKTRIFIATIFLAMVSALGATAQVVDTSFYKAQRGHYISLETGYGLMSVDHGMSSELNSCDLKYGVQARFSYRWYIFKYWAVGTGLHYQRFGTRSFVNNIQHIPGAVDELGRTIEHRTEFHGIEEDMSAHVFSVPAGMYLHGIQILKRLKMNFGAGVMFNFPLSNSYTTKGGLETRLYYDVYHLEVGGINGHHVYTAQGFKGKYEMIPSLSLYGELGFIYSLNRRIDITLTGLGAYGLNPTISSDKYLYDPDCMVADSYVNTKYNGVLNSEESYGVRLVNAGGMIGIRYHIGTFAIDPAVLERERRVRQMQDVEFERSRTQDFEQVVRHRRWLDEEDSVLVYQEEERRKRELQDADFIRQQQAHKQDSVVVVQIEDIIGKVEKTDTTKTEQPEDDGSVITRSVELELESLMVSLSRNTCKFNDSHPALSRQQKKDLHRLAELMMMFPTIEVYCIGHTCDIGGSRQNDKIALQRAEEFARMLEAEGVAASRIECISKGFKEPLVPNTSEANRAINRRVEIKRKK